MTDSYRASIEALVQREEASMARMIPAGRQGLIRQNPPLALISSGVEAHQPLLVAPLLP
jgi:hypothetical protein